MKSKKTGLDSPDFDANDYFLDLLKNNNLKQLVDQNLNIQSQIKSFDHDIQSMVSDNYSKFISSIDIVKKMKDNIEGVEKKMEKLEGSINKINHLALKIDSTLETKRSEIKKLDLINKDLSNLKKLCEFPTLLKKELEVYKSSLRSASKDSAIGKMTTAEFPTEVLERLQLDKVFRQSAEYYLECGEKLIMYKDEKLIKPLYEESRVYIDEIKNILYSLIMNKNLDSNSRDVFLNYLCFEKDHASMIKTYFRNLSERYISKNPIYLAKLRSIFFLALKLSENLKQEAFEIEFSGEKFSIEAGNLLSSAAFSIGELQQKDQSRINSAFHHIKKESLAQYRAKVLESTLLNDIEAFFSNFKEDLIFYLGRVRSLLQPDDFKLLVDVSYFHAKEL